MARHDKDHIDQKAKQMQTANLPKLSVFYCINSFAESALLAGGLKERADVTFVKMPCSSMVKDVFLLRAFEADADAVIVLVCPEGQCRYIEGNIRAKKRVAWVRKLLDEIGLDGRRLSLFNVEPNDDGAVAELIAKTVSDLQALGPNPARSAD